MIKHFQNDKEYQNFLDAERLEKSLAEKTKATKPDFLKVTTRELHNPHAGDGAGFAIRIVEASTDGYHTAYFVEADVVIADGSLEHQIWIDYQAFKRGGV